MNDKWKYVSVGKCVSAIIWSILGFCLLFVPYSFGDNSFTTMSVAPIFGNSGFMNGIANASIGFAGSFGLDGSISLILANVIGYAFYGYIIITLVTILFGIVLAIFRIKVLRIIFKVFSIVFGIALFIAGISFILYVVGILMYSLQSNPEAMSSLTDVILDNGIIFSLLATVFSFIMGSKQFGWFSRPFEIVKK